jgi:hypothetical protein
MWIMTEPASLSKSITCFAANLLQTQLHNLYNGLTFEHVPRAVVQVVALFWLKWSVQSWQKMRVGGEWAQFAHSLPPSVMYPLNRSLSSTRISCCLSHSKHSQFSSETSPLCSIINRIYITVQSNTTFLFLQSNKTYNYLLILIT